MISSAEEPSRKKFDYFRDEYGKLDELIDDYVNLARKELGTTD